jgi:hypothetical protein
MLASMTIAAVAGFSSLKGASVAARVTGAAGALAETRVLAMAQFS